MTRISTGGAYERRGQFFIRITIGAQKRVSEHCPSATSLEDAALRARAVQALVNRLRHAGKLDFVARLVEVGARSEPAKMPELDRFVDGVVGGAIVKDDRQAAAGPARTLSKLADQWLAAVGSLYDPATHRTLSQYAARWPDFFGDDGLPSRPPAGHDHEPLRALERAVGGGGARLPRLPPRTRRRTRRQGARRTNENARRAGSASGRFYSGSAKEGT